MELCICRDKNEAAAREGLKALSLPDLQGDWRDVSAIVTQKAVGCGMCGPDWQELIREELNARQLAFQ